MTDLTLEAVRWACSNSISPEQFDRWIAEHDAEVLSRASITLSEREVRKAKAEAWEEGREAGFDTGNEYGQGYEFPVSADNPYAEES